MADSENNFMKDAEKLMGNLGKSLEKVMNMLPDTPVQRVTLNGMSATACILKDGRVLIEFADPADAKRYVDELGIKK